MFPMESTSVETPAVDRVCRVLDRTRARRHIAYGACYACRRISGSSSWSQHSWGNAVDLFPRSQNDVADATDRRVIANTVVYQATHRTVANRGRKLDVAEVIDHSGRRIWTPSRGWHGYLGALGNHIHVSASPLRSGVPPCAQ